MEQLFFSYEHSDISPDELQKLHRQLLPEIKRIATAHTRGYTTEYASVALPFDTTMHQNVDTVIAAKKSLHPSMLIIIGIGGSNLGTLAVMQALRGIFYNDQAMQCYFADSVDPRYTQSLYTMMQQALIRGNNVLLTIISKSGTTTETIANAQLFTALLMQYKKNYQEYLVVISDEGSVLWQIAQKQGISCLQIPTNVGGRFSVFSPVGLFPLGMLDIDIKALLKGAASVQALTQTFDNNPAAVSAALLYAQYQKGIVIHDMFFFVAQCEGIGRWYRQLLAESIGKIQTNNGQSVRIGITPTISIGSVDLHSMAQLYLAGPHNRMTTFIWEQALSDVRVPSGTPFDRILPMIHHKKLSTLMHAMVKGTQKAYEHEKLPYMSIELPQISAYYIGQFMQLKMMEIMYLGALFQVNPFNQPHVELYKEETRKILAHD